MTTGDKNKVNINVIESTYYAFIEARFGYTGFWNRLILSWSLIALQRSLQLHWLYYRLDISQLFDKLHLKDLILLMPPFLANNFTHDQKNYTDCIRSHQNNCRFIMTFFKLGKPLFEH